MPTWKITETCEYTVEAPTQEAAEQILLDHGPEISVESPVSFDGVTARLVDKIERD